MPCNQKGALFPKGMASLFAAQFLPFDKALRCFYNQRQSAPLPNGWEKKRRMREMRRNLCRRALCAFLSLVLLVGTCGLAVQAKGLTGINWMASADKGV